MKKREFAKVMEAVCPPELAEAWDNSGFQVNCEKDEIERVLVALEVTSEVIAEAVERQADLILTHHPLIFGGIKNIDYSDVTGKYICELLKNNISVYSCHTNFDKMEGGNNDYIGRLLDLENVRSFDRDNGFCLKGETPFETTFRKMIYQVAEAFQIDAKYFSTVGDETSYINCVGWCSGSGSEFIKTATDEGCDLYITGDVKYHDAMFAAEKGICVLDAGHFGSEKIFAENMADILRYEMKDYDVEIIESIIDINPFI